MLNTTGVLLPPSTQPSRITEFARAAETAGFDTLWVVEDCFFNGGIAQAGVVLAVTSRMTVGIGILPAAARNPAFAAMEIATLAGLFPGRVVVGVGHGMPAWIRQVGAWPASPLALLQETLEAIQALLAGDRVTVNGRYVKLRDVQLAAPPTVVPKILAGVRGPKSLELAGRCADGVILAEPVTPEYLRYVKDQVGERIAGKNVVAYNIAAVDGDSRRAFALARPALEWIGEPDWAAQIAPLPFAAEFVALRRRSPTREAFAASLPDDWVQQLAVVGTQRSARRRIEQLHEAGASDVVLIPAGPDPTTALAALVPLVPTAWAPRGAVRLPQSE